MGWLARGLRMAVLITVALMLLPASGPLPSPFDVRTRLPKVAKGQYYQLIADGYAVRRSVHSDAVAVVDLRTGRDLWRTELRDGIRNIRSVDGVLLISATAYVDKEHQAVGFDDRTVAFDLVTGAELWRHTGQPLSTFTGSTVPLWCNCSTDTVAVNLRTGQELWHSPGLRSSNLLDGHEQWTTDRDGTVRAIDVQTGTARLVGTLPRGYFIIGANDRYILAVPPSNPGYGSVVYPGVGLFDRHDLHQISYLKIENHASIPPELWPCGDLLCQRDGSHMTVYDQQGSTQYERKQFLLGTVIERDGKVLIVGVQNRSGVVVPGSPMDTNQFVDAATGTVLSDIGAWRLLKLERDRLWVGLFASRNTSTLIVAPAAEAREDAFLGYVDLRPGSPLTVTRVAPLDGAFEDCDLAYGWLLCTNRVTGERPLALHLPA